MQVIYSIILGIVLGITEFLPISSLGHSLVLTALFKFPPTDEASKAIALFIQGGAVLAVIVYYARDLFSQAQSLPSSPKTRRFWLNIFIAFVPIGIIGLVFNKWIEDHLFTPAIVGLALILGGIAFLLVEQYEYKPHIEDVESITPKQALFIGVVQILALIPGVSRSGATIIGGMLTGLDRKVATIFTFYLFIPTLGAAVLYELYKRFQAHQIDGSFVPYYFLATIVAFAVSLIAIRWLLRYISTHNFKALGIYRIAVGVVIIALVIARIL